MTDAPISQGGCSREEKTMVDKAGNHFKNRGDCVSYFVSKGKYPGAAKP
jgi:hypothetical protein